jgi:hypothetical protein
VSDFLRPTQTEADFRARRTNNEPKGEENNGNPNA